MLKVNKEKVITLICSKYRGGVSAFLRENKLFSRVRFYQICNSEYKSAHEGIEKIAKALNVKVEDILKGDE